MFIATKIVMSMETGEVLDRQGFEYAGALAECKSKSPDPAETQAFQVGNQQNQKRDAAFQGANAQAGQLNSAVDPFLNQYMSDGPDSPLSGLNNTIQSYMGNGADSPMSGINATLKQYQGNLRESPLYQSLLTSGTQSTNHSYDDAQAATRMRANASGFGYAQPVAQGADKQLDNQRAAALAQMPNQALQGAVGPQLQAAQMGLQAAGMPLQAAGLGLRAAELPLQAAGMQQQGILGQANLMNQQGMAYNGAPYYGYGTQLAQQRRNQSGGLFDALAKIGGTAMGGMF